MLYGFGDDPVGFEPSNISLSRSLYNVPFQNPYTETVDLLEELVLEFINDMTGKAMEIGKPGKVQVRMTRIIEEYKPREFVLLTLFVQGV